MKKLSNGQNAFCYLCGHNGAVINQEAQAVCGECGCQLLKTAWGKDFVPQFHSNMFKRNKYTPPIICRRRRQLPIKVERRVYESIPV